MEYLRSRIEVAAEQGDISLLVNLIRESGDQFDVNAQAPPRLGRYTLLHCALFRWVNGILRTENRSNLVRLLCAHGANVNAADTMFGCTPLHYASMVGNTQVVAILLRAGAVVDARDIALYTPLMFAAWAAHPATIKLLLEAGADPALQERLGRTARRVAERYNQRAAVEALDSWAVRARGAGLSDANQ